MPATKTKTPARPKPAAKKAGGKKPGRPPGKATEPAPEVAAELTRCPRCGSTERSKYLSYKELAQGVRDPRTGEVATHTVWRRCRCEACGQLRTDRHRENRKPVA